jgi:hypothetical protein
MSISEQNRDLLPVDESAVDDLDRKLLDVFAGRVVRKDLVKKLKVGFNIPVYVLEYLLGKFCSTTNQDEIEVGLRQVKETITERIVRADQGELIKARLQKQGSMRIIDLCTVTFDEKDQGGKYWARLAASGLDYVHVEPELVHKHERLFTGGIWANIELSYDERSCTEASRGLSCSTGSPRSKSRAPNTTSSFGDDGSSTPRNGRTRCSGQWAMSRRIRTRLAGSGFISCASSRSSRRTSTSSSLARAGQEVVRIP